MNEEQAFIVRHEDNERRKEALPVDILGREELIAQVLELLNTLSEVRSSCTFALNGKWGAGKTYIIKKWSSSYRITKTQENLSPFIITAGSIITTKSL